MILSDHKIREVVDTGGGISIEPFNPDHMEPASYDLTVGDQAVSTVNDEVVNVKSRGFFELPPGSFAIITTREKIALDNSHVARFGLVSSYARRGVVATTGLHVDPGFNGLLVIGLTNISSKTISFPHRDKFLSIEFHQLAEPAQQGYTGPYQGRDCLEPEDIRIALDREVDSMPEMMQTVRALVTTVEGLKMTVEGLQTSTKDIKSSVRTIQWLIGVGIALIALLAFLSS